MSGYATKAELKSATGIHTSNFALKSKLASLKTEVDKLDIDKIINCSCWFKWNKWCDKKWCR